MLDEITRPTVLEVNLSDFKYNIKQIKNFLKPETVIMPVIKAEGYGTYINKRLDIINEFDIVAVAIVDEGEDLRKIGYKKDIFVLNQPYISEIDKIAENNLIVGICEKSFLDEVKKKNFKIRVHIEIETGMGRTGVDLNNLDNFIKKIKENPNIKVEGVYTHLSSADEDVEYTKEQLEKFDKAVKKVKENFDIKYVHCLASNGIINFSEAQYNLVRPGIIMYGYESGEGIKEKIDLKPVVTLKSKISYIKEVEENTSISYGRRFITKRKSKIATVPIGYADGLRRVLSNVGEVVINGKKAPIIGSICMDSFMVDVTDIENVSLGDDVYIWDNELIKLEDIAKKCDTINYEILSTISKRVPRKFINTIDK